MKIKKHIKAIYEVLLNQHKINVAHGNKIVELELKVKQLKKMVNDDR